MKPKRFRETIIREWESCVDCPYNEDIDNAHSPCHSECTKTGLYIDVYTNSGYTDFTNEEGILNTCPFLNHPSNTEAHTSSNIALKKHLEMDADTLLDWVHAHFSSIDQIINISECSFGATIWYIPKMEESEDTYTLPK